MEKELKAKVLFRSEYEKLCKGCSSSFHVPPSLVSFAFRSKSLELNFSVVLSCMLKNFSIKFQIISTVFCDLWVGDPDKFWSKNHIQNSGISLMTANKKFVFGDMDVCRHLTLKKVKVSEGEEETINEIVPLRGSSCCSAEFQVEMMDEILLLGSFKAINQNQRPILKINCASCTALV